MHVANNVCRLVCLCFLHLGIVACRARARMNLQHYVCVFLLGVLNIWFLKRRWVLPCGSLHRKAHRKRAEQCRSCRLKEFAQVSRDVLVSAHHLQKSRRNHHIILRGLCNSCRPWLPLEHLDGCMCCRAQQLSSFETRCRDLPGLTCTVSFGAGIDTNHDVILIHVTRLGSIPQTTSEPTVVMHHVKRRECIHPR